MTKDISITRACKGDEDTAIAKVDMGVTGYRTFESTTIDELTLGHVGIIGC